MKFKLSCGLWKNERNIRKKKTKNPISSIRNKDFIEVRAFLISSEDFFKQNEVAIR